jgi:hypothetical protein
VIIGATIVFWAVVTEKEGQPLAPRSALVRVVQRGQSIPA